jgi:hypothetical protein
MHVKQFFPLFSLLCCMAGQSLAQQPGRQPDAGFWTDVPEVSLRKINKTENRLPDEFRLMEVQIEWLADWLSKLPLDYAKVPAKPKATISLPMPDGSAETFVLYNDPIMHPDLARRYPEIQTFGGYAQTDPTTTLRLDMSPHGFNATILSDKRDAVLITPVAVGDNRHNISYFKKHSHRDKNWTCYFDGHHADKGQQKAESMAAGDCGTRREYRLALAATAEYTNFHGGTVALALAAMNTTMNRVNAVYERDCSIRMNLIADTDDLIYTDAMTDPYTNGNTGAMIGENQSNVDTEIGGASYDIGHVFGLNSGGLASLGVVCSGSKARGVTGSGSPIGDAFDIDYVAHEMGHQFNGDHTFNENSTGSCDASNVNASTAFEPGSGTTIMAYAGICGATNVQSNSDAYFHAISLQQIGNFVVSGGGSGCANNVAVANNPPTVNAGANFTIPVSTPFRLTATGSDPNGNPLTFCWEQMDNQLIPHPPATTATEGPVFRSFTPVTSPTRYFPRLPVILDNTLPSTWEVLPAVARTMNFRATVRDNLPNGGCTDEDDMVVTVSANAGPFRITGIGPDDDCLFADASTTITWDVANTTAAPVSCANVDIWLSTDGGQNFSTLLADNVPNSGSASVNVPATAITQTGRIMVICSDNIFLNVNQKDIRIDCPANITVTDNPAAGTYQARQRVVTSGNVVVLPATTARFFAGEDIVMTDGFWARQGSDFIARIQTCNHCAGSKPESVAAEKENKPKVNFYEDPADARSRNKTDGSGLNASVMPNPFSDQLTVNFEVTEPGPVLIELIDLTGRLVATIYQNNRTESGMHRVTHTANNLPAGMYSCRILVPGGFKQISVVKM